MMITNFLDLVAVVVGGGSDGIVVIVVVGVGRFVEEKRVGWYCCWRGRAPPGGITP